MITIAAFSHAHLNDNPDDALQLEMMKADGMTSVDVNRSIQVEELLQKEHNMWPERRFPCRAITLSAWDKGDTAKIAQRGLYGYERRENMGNKAMSGKRGYRGFDESSSHLISWSCRERKGIINIQSPQDHALFSGGPTNFLCYTFIFLSQDKKNNRVYYSLLERIFPKSLPKRVSTLPKRVSTLPKRVSTI